MISFTRLHIKSPLSQFVTVSKHCAASFSFCLFPLFLRFGRHPVLILSVLFMLVFGVSVAFSVNVTMFSTLRFFEGFCLAGLALSLYVLSKYISSPASCLSAFPSLSASSSLPHFLILALSCSVFI